MQDRIRILLDHLGITPAEFADTLRVPRSSVSHILSGRNNPSLEFLRKMLTTYPMISADWLLLGQGQISREYPPGKPEVITASPSATKSPLHKSAESDTAQAKGPGKERAMEPAQFRGNEKENREPSEPPVEKVIIFYADGTFTLFCPRDNT